MLTIYIDLNTTTTGVVHRAGLDYFHNTNSRVASCDTGPTSPFSFEDIMIVIPGRRTIAETTVRHNPLIHISKEYRIQLKPLISAFKMKPLMKTLLMAFPGQFLAVAARWLVQVGIEFYCCARDMVKSENEGEDVDIVVNNTKRAKVLGRRVCGVTVKCGASLVFASIGAGIGAILFRPKAGQSVGCSLGDMVGPIIVSYCFANVPHLELWSV